MSVDEHVTDGQAPDAAPHSGRRQVDTLIDIGRASFELFHDDQERPYARANGDVFLVPSRECAARLRIAFREEEGRYPAKWSLAEAMDALAAEGVHECPEESVYLRVGGDRPRIVLDLADEHRRVVRIQDGFWTVGADSPVNFPRRTTTQAIPAPRSGGALSLLRPFVNVSSDDEFMLVCAWLVMALSPVGPYPLLVLQGEQGSAKSTTAKVLKSLVDPVAAPLRAAPRTLRDLAIMAESNWVVAFDNLSGLSPDLSDGLCRLATGGGFSTRSLYTDDQERVFEQQRPVILNGIDAVATRQDLLDRAIVLRLPRLNRYRDEASLWDDFAEERPLILGALLDGAATAMQAVNNTHTDGRHRMADFVRWVTAAAPTLGWAPQDFTEAYEANQASSLRMSLDSSPVAREIRRLMEQRRMLHEENDRVWEGTPTDLYAELQAHLSDSARRGRAWPANPQALSSKLTMLAPALRQDGIEVEHTTVGRDRAKERWIVVRPIGDTGDAGDANGGMDEDE